MKLALSFIIGFSVGVASLAAFNFWDTGSTEIWKSRVELTTESGMLLPAGTELVLVEYMPEGYVALSLAVNVEGPEQSLFGKSDIDNRNVRLPVWVQKNY